MDDLISREAVLSKKIYTETEEGWSGYTVDADYIEHLPSVTQSITRYIEKSNFSQEQYLLDTDSAYQIGYEQGKSEAQKSGKWKQRETDNTDWWECSECGAVIYSENEYDMNEYHRFCGRCGAKMVEPQERSE